MADSISVHADFSPGSSNSLALQERLRPKLLDAGYATEELVSNFCEFITIMIGNAKTKEQITSELVELIGDEFDPAFTDWLFDEVDNTVNHTGSNGHEMQDESMSQAQPVSSPSRRHLKDAPTSARSAAAPYPQPTRVVDQINRQLERAPVKHSIPDLPNVPTGPRAQSFAGPIRRGRDGGRGPMNPAMPPNFEAFMMASGMPLEMVQQMMVTATNMPNPMFSGFGGMNLADRITGDGSTGIVVAGGDRARCRHWPRCQLGARCKFHHPSQICPDYPNCPNLGGTCQYIHVGVDIPESDVQKVVFHQLANGGRPVNGHKTSTNSNPTSKGTSQRQENRPAKARPKKTQEQVPLCKFGAGCTKSDCPFAHPTPAAGTDGLVLRGEMCPNGRDCLNKECDMGHPSQAVEGIKRKETENCKFFPNCTNPDCPYKHPAVPVSKALSIPCKFGINCTRPNCIFNHGLDIPCRYNPCLNEHCLFKHLEGQQPNKNKVWTADGNEAGSMAERKFAYENAEESIIVGGAMDELDETAVHE